MARSPYVIEYEGVFAFPVPPLALWDALERVDRFERWWNWLSDFRLEGDGLTTGSTLQGVVAPPLPYRMRLTVDIEDCERPRRIDAGVHGDLEGHACLHLEGAGTGSEVRVEWTIEMMQRPMRLAALFGYPVLRWGHDRVVDATVHSFRRHLADCND